MIHLFSGSQNPVSKTIYTMANELVELCSKFICFGTAKVTPIFLVCPNAIVCYINYFVTDQGNDAFISLNPIWWAFFTTFFRCVSFWKKKNRCSISFISILKKLYFELFKCNRFPFDWKNPFGFMMANILQYVGTLATFIALGACLCFGIGTFILLLAIADDVKCEISSINQIHQTKSNRLLMFERFAKLINFHTDVKKLDECKASSI